ncbi:MAG TPA: hypothetical protein VEI57_08165 [Nitrospirota bacterium]|nr:hypothetical protein [Nitrospirota bacterium]
MEMVKSKVDGAPRCFWRLMKLDSHCGGWASLYDTILVQLLEGFRELVCDDQEQIQFHPLRSDKGIQGDDTEITDDQCWTAVGIHNLLGSTMPFSSRLLDISNS